MTLQKDFHFVWGGPEMPERFRDNLKAWADMHDGWDLTLWGDDDLRWLEHRDLYDNAAEHVPDDAVWQFRSDIARYEILARYGGLYCDTDVKPLKNIEPALVGHDAFAVAETPRWVGNTVIYCEPHHPVMNDIAKGLRANIARLSPARANVLSGPRYFTGPWRAHGCYEAETKLFFPWSWSDVMANRYPEIPSSAYTVHEFNHARTMRGLPNERRTRRAARVNRQRGR